MVTEYILHKEKVIFILIENRHGALVFPEEERRCMIKGKQKQDMYGSSGKRKKRSFVLGTKQTKNEFLLQIYYFLWHLMIWPI